ncbi:MAG TPA: type II toxin-antitoxin system RelE/ParE family toxin [Clostridiaceae bacterium]|nr:type II toxin-antitoxin system RelE/ParE family toxin [Clostridiaceae bacterium]
MGANFKVFWTHIAVSDLRRIVEYITREDLVAAEEIYGLIRDQTEGLGQLPHRGRIVPELQLQGVLLYREIVQTPWRIIYRVLGDKVVILAVIDGRRNIADILLERILGID